MDEHFETVIVGGGQAGLAAGYHLKKRGIPFVILDAQERIGDSWRTRWDSLRLFTPAKYDGLPGMRFPAPRWSFPTKDEMGDYLEAYAARFDLSVRNGAKVDRLSEKELGAVSPRIANTGRETPGRIREFPGARIWRRWTRHAEIVRCQIPGDGEGGKYRCCETRPCAKISEYSQYFSAHCSVD